MLWISSTTPSRPLVQIGKGSALAEHHLQHQQRLGQARNTVRTRRYIPQSRGVAQDPREAQLGLVSSSIPVVEILHDENEQKYMQKHLHARNKVRA